MKMKRLLLKDQPQGRRGIAATIPKMPSTTIFKRGDIILLPFPLTDLSRQLF